MASQKISGTAGVNGGPAKTGKMKQRAALRIRVCVRRSRVCRSGGVRATMAVMRRRRRRRGAQYRLTRRRGSRWRGVGGAATPSSPRPSAALVPPGYGAAADVGPAGIRVE
ncbi:Hypothetical protein NTJ_03332 [Nesidiocoris tenuis]|uniref:Histone H2A C-terminal domain-containing protein n=1 Tax=Nesidiocoris tenuis TaxID=355587 RepID=A0ABN7AH44_9HEMI|nr:Hypothetical protein NTJ_03332 [Nesidiocoris tenuis]